MDIDFSDCMNSKYGLKAYEFIDIPLDIQKKIIILMARIMERAYRRGVQQTLEMKNIDDWIIDDSYNYRYGKSLHVSIGLDGFTTTSIHRLFTEEKIEYIFDLNKSDF